MHHDVHIRVRGEQYYEDGTSDGTELEIAGKLTRLAEGWSLSYREESGEMAGTYTEFLVSAGEIALKRTGALSSEMVFSPDAPHRSLYETPYGSLTMEVVTEAMHAVLTEQGGSIDISYAINVDGRPLGKNKFHIQVKSTDNRG